MRKNDINLADLTPAGCLLVLLTVALVLVSVVWTVSSLPDDWARFIPKKAAAIPVALMGVLFFWMCARILGSWGFRIQRSRGEPKIVAISFGFFLLLIGITSLLLPVVLMAGFGRDLPVETPVLLGFGGIVFIVLGAMLLHKAIITQREERRTDTQYFNDSERENEAPWRHPIGGSENSQDGKYYRADPSAAPERPRD
jgi:hypothetical protein